MGMGIFTKQLGVGWALEMELLTPLLVWQPVSAQRLHYAVTATIMRISWLSEATLRKILAPTAVMTFFPIGSWMILWGAF